MSTEAVTRTERADLTEALRHAVHHAKRQMYVVKKFTADPPTKWDAAHNFINGLLDDWQAAP